MNNRAIPPVDLSESEEISIINVTATPATSVKVFY